MPSALSFLTHFAGDIHQPLHVSYTVDLGGNSFSVKFINNMTNLHLLWDDEMIDYYGKDYMGLASEFISYLQAHPELVSQYQANLDPIDWATESFALTSTTVYNVLPENRKSTTDVDEFGGSLANGNCTFCISVYPKFKFCLRPAWQPRPCWGSRLHQLLWLGLVVSASNAIDGRSRSWTKSKSGI
jgi:hypothetical protein